MKCLVSRPHCRVPLYVASLFFSRVFLQLMCVCWFWFSCSLVSFLINAISLLWKKKKEEESSTLSLPHKNLLELKQYLILG